MFMKFFDHYGAFVPIPGPATTRGPLGRTIPLVEILLGLLPYGGWEPSAPFLF